MDIIKKNENGTATLSIVGKVDSVSAPQLEEALLPTFGEAEQVVLDFSEVTYVTSAGLRVLITGHEAAQTREASLVLRHVSEDVMEVLDMTGFSSFLVIE